MAKKSDRIEEILLEQNSLLHELKVISEQNSELLKKHDGILDEMVLHTAKNTEDLKYHIKRTDILQNKVQFMILGLAVVLGGASVKFGPSILQILTYLF